LNLLAAVVLFCGLPLLVALLVRVAAHTNRTIAFAGAGFLLCTVVFGFQCCSRPIVGVVTGKSEILDISTRGLAPRVTHRLVLIAAVSPTIASAPPQYADSLQFDVDESLYDSVREGERIALHRLRLGPLSYARLNAAAWWNFAPGRLEGWLPQLHAGAPVLARARILSVRTVLDAYVYSWVSLVDQGTVHTALSEPYEEIRVRWSTAQGAQIVALDRIDAGSAGALAPGMWVSVTYPQDRPRTARLVAGQRTFVWRNARNYWGGEAIAAGIVFLGIGLAESARRRFYRRWDALRQAREARRRSAADTMSRDGR
jgi:hypothetical protein